MKISRSVLCVCKCCVLWFACCCWPDLELAAVASRCVSRTVTGHPFNLSPPPLTPPFQPNIFPRLTPPSPPVILQIILLLLREDHHQPALSQRYSIFRDITRNVYSGSYYELLRGIFCVVSRFPLHFKLNFWNLDYFWDSVVTSLLSCFPQCISFTS